MKRQSEQGADAACRAGTETEYVRHCEGCDQYCEGVREYDVTFNEHAGDMAGQTERVVYCPDCAGLAHANWNGAIAKCVAAQS